MRNAREMTRVWFVSELYYPEETSTGYLLTRLAEGLAQRATVFALCGQPTYSGRGTRAQRTEIHSGVEIFRCWSTTFNKDRLAGRLANLFTITVSLFVSAVRRFRRDDIAIVVTNPPALPYLVLAACALTRSRYILLVHDVYPEALYVAGILRRESAVSAFAERLASWPYRRAERIVVLGRDMRDLVAAKCKSMSETGIADKIVIIPNWADSDLVSPSDRSENALLHELNLTSRWVVLYAGNMGRTHGLEGVVESVREVSVLDPSVHFLFIGSGAHLTMLQDAAQSIPTITICSARPRDDQPNFLNACDVALVSFSRNMSGVSVPSRMYNIFAAGKPVVAVADRDSELAQIILENDVGWVVPPHRPDLLSQTIIGTRRALQEDPAMMRRARQVAEKYSLDSAIDSYHRLVDSLSTNVPTSPIAVAAEHRPDLPQQTGRPE